MLFSVVGEEAFAVAGTMDLTSLLVAIANSDHKAAVDLLNATPSSVSAGLARRDEFFRGSTASDLARWTTGRGGTGSAAAKAEQRIIVELLGNTP